MWRLAEIELLKERMAKIRTSRSLLRLFYILYIHLQKIWAWYWFSSTFWLRDCRTIAVEDRLGLPAKLKLWTSRGTLQGGRGWTRGMMGVSQGNRTGFALTGWCNIEKVSITLRCRERIADGTMTQGLCLTQGLCRLSSCTVTFSYETWVIYTRRTIYSVAPKRRHNKLPNLLYGPIQSCCIQLYLAFHEMAQIKLRWIALHRFHLLVHLHSSIYESIRIPILRIQEYWNLKFDPALENF